MKIKVVVLFIYILQINKAKKLSEEPLKLSPSIFTEGFIGQYSATQAREGYLSLFFQTTGYICLTTDF